MFERYVTHVMHAIKKEKVRNPATGRMEDPDEEMMREVERTLEISGPRRRLPPEPDREDRRVVARPQGQKPVMAEIFADLLRKLRDAYFERHKKTIAKGISDLVVLLSGNEGHLSARRATRADAALETLITRYGYTRESARDLVGALAGLRYR